MSRPGTIRILLPFCRLAYPGLSSIKLNPTSTARRLEIDRPMADWTVPSHREGAGNHNVSCSLQCVCAPTVAAKIDQPRRGSRRASQMQIPMRMVLRGIISETCRGPGYRRVASLQLIAARAHGPRKPLAQHNMPTQHLYCTSQ